MSAGVAPSALAMKLTRRNLLRYGLRLSILSFFGVGFAGRNDLVTERVNLSFPNLPEAFDRFTIVQISDLHAGFWVDGGYLAQVVQRVNAMDKDLLVITGDMITGAVNDFWKRWLPGSGTDFIGTVVEALSLLREGIKLAVLGNHDQWSGREAEARLVGGLERIGIRVLRNRSVPIVRGGARIYLAGTDDYWFSCDTGKALRDVPPDAFKILLTHNPDARLEMGREVELTLCGHTHGGQVAIPFLTRHLIPIRYPDRYLSGLVREPYGYTYVNRGIGTLVFPLRINAPPEITAITLSP